MYKPPVKGKFLKKVPQTPNQPMDPMATYGQVMYDINLLRQNVIDTVEAELEKLEETKTFSEDTFKTMEKTIVKFKEEAIEAIRVMKKGEKGDSIDLETIVSEVLTKIRQPEDGKSIDEDAFIKKLAKFFTKKEDVDKTVKQYIKDFKKEKTLLKIIRENVEIDPISVIEKIMALPEKDRKKLKLGSDNISGLDQTISAFRNQLSRGYLHGGGGGGGSVVITGGPGILVSGAGTIASPYVISIYTAPAITLALVPSARVEEVGDTVVNPVLNATTTKQSSPITGVTFFRGSTLIHTQASPNPNGGLESYTDTFNVTTTTSYHAEVTDGTTIVASNIATYTFAFAYYYGVGNPGLNIGTDGGGLTKLVITDTATVAKIFNPTNQVFYFAYPDSYPALTSIKDTNGFETISDYTVTTGVAVTNSFGQTTTYRKYEYNNVTTQSNFTNTYIQ